MRLVIVCRRCGAEAHASIVDAYLDKGNALHTGTTAKFFATCEDCEGKAAQQPAPLDERSPKTLESRRVKPHNVVPEEIQESVVNSASVDELELSVRSANALKEAGVKTIGDIREMSAADLLRIPNIGKTSMKDIRRTVENFCFNYGKTIAVDQDRY